MKRGIFLIGLLLVFGRLLSAQHPMEGLDLLVSPENKDSVLLNIDGKPVSVAEFERIYKKNNAKDNPVDNKSMEEYLELFINFKLKVFEAEKLGLDTSKSFKTELAGYRKQLAKPYLVDKDIDESLLKEAYDRMQQDVNVSHILIKIDANASPKDTLDAYTKIMNARKRILAGEPFEKVAKETDPDAKENGGNLGYFTAFDMVYPFESAAYNTKIGEVSMPFRTSFGYHIIKVHDRRKAVGQIKVAHIMVTVPKGTSEADAAKAKDRIFSIYKKLKDGEEFAKVAKENSDDKGTASRGGDLPWFGTGRMVPEFDQAAFSLKNNGDISEPVKTSFGWHIIKRIDKKEIGTFDELKAEIRNKISKDERADRSRQAVIAKLKTEYNFKEFGEEIKDKGKKKKEEAPKIGKKYYEDFYTVITDSIFTGKWTMEEAAKLIQKLFTIGDSTYTQQDFAKYIFKFNRKSTKSNIKDFVNARYKEYVDSKVIKYEEDRLEKKYPDFCYLMNEYHDGILLFELTDKTVWSKAIKDTVGLKDFYEKNKTKYMWDTRYDLKVYSCKTEKISSKAFDMFGNNKKNLSSAEIMNTLNKKDTSNIKITEKGLFQKGDNKTVDGRLADMKDQKYFISKDESNKIIEIKKADPAPKSLDEAKGLITADYQTFLEEKWIKDLRAKYKVEVFKEALKKVK
ncbi:MAG: peptidylprolyl isomerase [Bacteroidia bacterium]|nr:peptidylprolyl isomerase [Bacteroidia bacterium]